MDFARATTGNAYYLQNGKVALYGKTDEVLENQLVKENYLGVSLLSQSK